MKTLARLVLLAAVVTSSVLVGCQKTDPVETYMNAVDKELVVFDDALETALGMNVDQAAELLDNLLAAQERFADLDVPEGAEALAETTSGYMDLVIRMVDEIVLQSCTDCAREYGAQAGAQRGVLDRDRLQPQGGH